LNIIHYFYIEYTVSLPGFVDLYSGLAFLPQDEQIMPMLIIISNVLII